MHHKKLVVTAAVLLFAVGAPAFAAKGGSEHVGGMSSTHMSESGGANSDAQFQADATKGQDRAAERRSAMGAQHEKATSHDTGKVAGKSKKNRKKSNVDATASK